MTKWEYEVIELDRDVSSSQMVTEFNHHGVNGWELVSVVVVHTHMFCTFKRPLP